MKSNILDLQRRGFADEQTIKLLETKNTEELCSLIHSSNASERTAATHLLTKMNAYNDDIIELVLQRLCKEKALYSKIELCTFLEKGGLLTASKMIPYLGIIGNNQHTKLPDKVSKKKSYPLARDIIARSLGRMNPSVLPILMDTLSSNDLKQVAEIIDAIGFLIFYNQDYATEKNYIYIEQAFLNYQNNDLILWKLTLCLSSFPLDQSREKLVEIINTSTSEIIVNEAKRSLSLIQK